MKRFVERIVDFAGNSPYWVLAFALALLGSSWFYASHLELHSDFLELLPRDSPGFKAFEHQLGRTGGGATLLVIVESPDRKVNERFIDDASARLDQIVRERKQCLASAAAARGGPEQKDCGPELISYVEAGTREVRRFFEDHKALYADLQDLEAADRTLDHEIAIRSGLVSDLEEGERAPTAEDAPDK
jgi:uncharacterized protein